MGASYSYFSYAQIYLLFHDWHTANANKLTGGMGCRQLLTGTYRLITHIANKQVIIYSRTPAAWYPGVSLIMQISAQRRTSR